MPSKTSKPPKNLLSQKKVVLDCSEQDLAELAAQLAPELGAGDRVILEGPMGAGKSTFVSYLLKALAVDRPAEGSPTFSIAHEYPSPVGDVIHLDFYRIKNEAEIEHAGIPAYYWERDAIVISEWLSSWKQFEQDVLEGVLEGRYRFWKISIDYDLQDRKDYRIVEVERL